MSIIMDDDAYLYGIEFPNLVADGDDRDDLLRDGISTSWLSYAAHQKMANPHCSALSAPPRPKHPHSVRRNFLENSVTSARSTALSALSAPPTPLLRHTL
jgi:hypothetical protein